MWVPKQNLCQELQKPYLHPINAFINKPSQQPRTRPAQIWFRMCICTERHFSLIYSCLPEISPKRGCLTTVYDLYRVTTYSLL